MESSASTQDLAYRPSLVGRTARVVIPVLHTILPGPLYRWTYDLLYGSYRGLLRASYEGRVLAAKLSGDPDMILRASLTRQLLPFTMGGRMALENAFDVTAQAERDGVEGALVECGVAEGGTAAMMALTNRELGTAPREMWFFDSYEGLPEPTQDDYEGGKTGDFIRPLPKGSCLGTIEQVSGLMFDDLGLPADGVHLIKGWFQDTVPVHREKVERIAVLRLDGDWYDSTKIPLESFYDLVSPGGFVIIDDYGTCFGSRKAADEFREGRGITARLVPDGRGGVWFRKPDDGRATA